MPKLTESQSLQDFDLRVPQQGRSPEERQQAMDAFIASVRDTDDATQTEIEKGIDQMLERIYSRRNPAPVLTEDEASTRA